MDAASIAEVNAATRIWVAAARTVHTEPFLTPLNLAVERERVLRERSHGRGGEPDFEYRPPRAADWERYISASRQIIGDHPLTKLLAKDLARTAGLLNALRHQDPRRLTEITLAEFGRPDGSLLDLAHSVLRVVPVVDSDVQGPLSADVAAGMLASAISTAGLTDWNVVVDTEMSARMSVRSLTSEVRVRADARFTHFEVERLVVHELGTHVARAVNGRTQLLDIVALGVPGYLATEEGLAAWHETRFSMSDPAVMRRYALRVIAVDLALRASFTETLDVIAEHTSDEDAFSIVQRAKRGIAGPAAAGAYVKDQVYFRGLIAVREHLEQLPSDYRLLMSGKVGLDALGWMRELDDDGRLTEPTVGPLNFRSSAD